MNYRVLYFFHVRNTAVLAHALTKKDKVPDAEIDRAVKRKQAFLKNPELHTHDQGVDSNGQDERRAADD